MVFGITNQSLHAGLEVMIMLMMLSLLSIYCHAECSCNMNACAEFWLIQFPGYDLDNYSLNYPVSLVNVGQIVGAVVAVLVVIIVVVVIVAATVHQRKRRRFIFIKGKPT